jgi:MFS family permease
VAGLAATSTFSALRHARFRRFWWGGVVSLVGSWMQITAQSWLVYDLTQSPLMLGTVTFANTTPTMLLALFGGAVADRSEKRDLLIGTQTTFMVAATILALLVLTGRVAVWHILALSGLTGIASALDMPARQSLIPHLVARSDMLNAIALNSAGFNGSRIIGPAIAGAVIEHLGGRAGAGWCFAINAVSYLAVIGALTTLDVNSRLETPDRLDVLSDVREGVGFAWRHPALRTYLLAMAVFGVFGLSYAVLMPVFAREVLRVDAGAYGGLLTANGIGATIGALTLATVRPARPGVVILGMLAASSVLLAAFAWSTAYPLSLALMVGVGGTTVGYMSLSNTTIQSIVPDALRGRIMSIYILCFFGTAPLGGLAMGSLAQALGAPAAVIVGAIVCALCAVIVWATARDVYRAAPAPAEPGPGG